MPSFVIIFTLARCGITAAAIIRSTKVQYNRNDRLQKFKSKESFRVTLAFFDFPLLSTFGDESNANGSNAVASSHSRRWLVSALSLARAVRSSSAVLELQRQHVLDARMCVYLARAPLVRNARRDVYITVYTIYLHIRGL